MRNINNVNPKVNKSERKYIYPKSTFEMHANCTRNVREIYARYNII